LFIILILKRENIHGDVLELLKNAKSELHEELTRLKKEKFGPDIEIGIFLVFSNKSNNKISTISK
jgi:hypothetical protein